jgi:hypothetical protein
MTYINARLFALDKLGSQSRLEPRMNSKLFAVCLAYSALCCGGASAQWFGTVWENNLTNEDRAMIKRTVQGEIHGKRPNTKAMWSNPASGHSGTITLLSKLTKQGLPCEKIEYVIKSSKPGEITERYVFTSCQLSDGTWKLAE